MAQTRAREMRTPLLGKDSALDAKPVVHDLYVHVVKGEAYDFKNQKARTLTLAILRYIYNHLSLLAEMGVRICVHGVKKSDLADQRFVQTMEAQGVSQMPALITPNDIYIGNQSIESVYDRNIHAYDAWKRRSVGRPTGMAPEDGLASFYREEMSFKKAAEDDGLGGDSDGVGEGGDMMDAYRSMMQKRERRDHRSPEAAQGRTADPPGRRRPDNVAYDASGSVDDPMDTFDQIAAEIDPQTFERAGASGGGGGLDSERLDTGESAQDDLMEKTYWDNQELST